MNACYSPSLFWEGIVLLAQLFPLPAFLCLILSSARWLPAGPTCPLVSAQILLAVQETGNILSETLPGYVYCLEIFKMFSHESDTVTCRRKVHLPESLPERAQTFVSQTRESMQPAPKFVVCKIKRFYVKIKSVFLTISASAVQGSG